MLNYVLNKFSGVRTEIKFVHHDTLLDSTPSNINACQDTKWTPSYDKLNLAQRQLAVTSVTVVFAC